MTSLAIAADQRSRRFHADIARRASLVPQREERTVYSIPNTPFGVKKIRPPLPPKIVRIMHPDQYYHCMWFADLVSPFLPKRPLSVERIQKTVAFKYLVSREDLLADGRTHDLVLPRQIAMYLAKVLLQRSLPEIGRRFGNRDHTTVLHAVRKISARCVSDIVFSAQIEALKAELRA